MIAVRTRRALDIKGADNVMAAAEKAATQNGFRVVMAIVDAWGHVLQLRRTEGAQAASDQVAIDKARTAAIFVRPSREIEQQVSSGRLGALALHGAAARESGGKAATHFPAGSVAAKFATGGLLHDTPGYKVDAGRRTAPGEVEYHEQVADIMRVVSGTATVVTGGRMIASRAVGPGETRADAIEGGTRRELGAGDVLVIPPGVPHHFTAVSDPFLYLVAKVRD